MIDLDHPLDSLARMMAHEQTRGRPWLAEDARQEALIAAWAEGDKPPGIIRFAMRRAAMHIDMGKSMTGNKRSPGRNGVDTHRRYGEPLVVTLPSGEEALAVEPVTDSAEDIVVAQDAQDRIREAVGSLPADDRRLVWLLHSEGLSQAEAGRRLGVSAKVVQRRLRHIYPALRPVLADVA